MDFDDIDQIKEFGFTGFIAFSELLFDKSTVPLEKGVYLVLNPKRTAELLPVGSGGCFRGKNPNVPIDILKSHWIDDVLVVYVGKAGGKGKIATLQSRLLQYARFGRGENACHYGGRYIWQLSNSADLIVCWKPTPYNNPREVEHELIAAFKRKYGRRPFANLQD